MTEAPPARIVVENDQFWHLHQPYGAMAVYVDGHRVGTASPRGRAVVPVSAGKHTVRVRHWWYRSPVQSVEVEAGGTSSLIARRPSMSLGDLMQAILRPSTCMKLFLSEEE